MSVAIFWISIGLVAYTYIGFPLLVLLRSRLIPRAYRPGNIEPSVSVIIAAYNEANCIGRKIENILGLDYPADKIELVVASDGSTDSTATIVEQYKQNGVRLLDLPRGGKAQALNAAVAVAHGEILVFSDANSMFDAGSLQALIRPFADPTIGGVAGNQCYEGPQSKSKTDLGERRYWDLDRWLKQAESRAGNVVSATGAIYAIRKSLFQSVPEGVTDDFVTSTRVIAQGYRLIFEEKAIAWEPTAKEQRTEFGRKVRIMNRGFRSVLCMKCLLNPIRYGFYSLQLLSHKVLRRVMVVPLIMLLVSSLMLMNADAIYRFAGYSQLAFYASAMWGFCATTLDWRLPKAAALSMYFCLVNAAALVAITRLFAGRAVVLWEPQRQREGEAPAEPLAGPRLGRRLALPIQRAAGG